MALRGTSKLLAQIANAARHSTSSLPSTTYAAQCINQQTQELNFSSNNSWISLAFHALGLAPSRALSTLGEISYPAPSAVISQPAPDFTAPAVVGGEIGSVRLSSYKGKWVVLFFYPKDFTFVCPTEIIAFSDRAKEFEAINAQLIAASTDTEETHLAWIKTPRNRGGLGYMQIPIVADTTKIISAKYGVLIPDKGIPLRGLFIIDPQGTLRQVTINDLPVGRSVDETLRLVQALQFVDEHGEVCPANWKPGEKTMIADPEKSMDYFSSVHAAQEELGSELRSVASPAEFHELVESGRPVVVDFYAPWCGKCRMIAPFLDELASKFPNVTFAKLDTSAEPLQDFSSTLGIKALPAFRFYKGGKQIGEQLTGYKKKPLEEAVASLAN